MPTLDKTFRMITLYIMSDVKSIRDIYSEIGVETYYLTMPYSNPHEKEVIKLLTENHQLLNLSNVLDLCCGDGLITTTLSNLGYNNIIGCDPFLFESYKNKTGKLCFQKSFLDIAKYGIPFLRTQKYSCIICSFGLHLCEPSLLPILLHWVSCATHQLVVIAPSKHPIIDKPKIDKFCFNNKNKRTHMRIYSL